MSQVAGDSNLCDFILVTSLSYTLHSSIGQNIKSHIVSGLRYPLSGVRSPARVWRTSNGRNSATRHPIYFVFGSIGFFSEDSFI